MANPYLDQVEFDSSNPEARCPCVLLLDVSGSMRGPRIEQLNEGLRVLQQTLQEDDLASMRVEIAIVSFGHEVRVEQDFVTAMQFEAKTLATQGLTPMGEAVNLALDMVSQRKDVYRQNGVPYYRPWLFLITDGAPTDDWQSAAQKIKAQEAQKSIAFFTVGVEEADMNILGELSTRAPLALKGLNFQELFVWLSQSLTSVSHSQVGEQVPLQSPAGWAEV